MDLNLAPMHILKKVSGLNATTAKAIAEWRNKNGAFISREQLREVKGIGEKVFQQCAGFVKIFAGDEVEPSTLKKYVEKVFSVYD